MSLAFTARFVVPKSVISETEAALRSAGKDGYELFVLWSGTVHDDVFTARTAHVPKQQSYKLADGLCVRVGGEALHSLNVWLFDHSETLGVQVHSHPRDAYHSTTDNTYPIVTALGGLSIVTPEFCRGGLLGRGHAIYRLSARGWSAQRRPVIELA